MSSGYYFDFKRFIIW